jgi:anti-sigma-K factor RskA
MVAYSEDHIALAAEYALGTVDADERAQVETMMALDKDFAALVNSWEFKLGALNQMVGLIEPRPVVWENIQIAIGHAEPQAAIVLPEAPAPAVPDLFATAPGDEAVDNVAPLRFPAEARRWRTVATVATAIAAALVAMLAVQVFQPDLLPEVMRTKPREQIAEVKPPSTPPSSAQYVALLQKEGSGPAFILTVDGATKKFTVRKVGATAAEPGTSFELWLISDKLPRPRSLGVINPGDFTERPLLASYDNDIVNAATYAVTIEQAGGSPDGNPHSAPVYTGKLIETVPPAAPAQPH